MSKPSIHVIDASAFLCLIFSEPGFDRVEAVMSGAAMSAVNYAEVIGKFVDGGLDPAEMVADLARLDVEIVPIDRDLAKTAGRFRMQTRSAGLSLGANSSAERVQRTAKTASSAFLRPPYKAEASASPRWR